MINGRPAFDEALPVGLSLFNACLLQYDFREPDGIRVSCLSPRQHPSIFLVPLQYGGCETHSGDKVTESVAKNKISGDIFLIHGVHGCFLVAYGKMFWSSEDIVKARFTMLSHDKTNHR